MEVLVCYDVSTESAGGAEAAAAGGQRLFGIWPAGAEVDLRMPGDGGAAGGAAGPAWCGRSTKGEDCLRIYRLAGPRERFVRVWGTPPPHDFREPLVV